MVHMVVPTTVRYAYKERRNKITETNGTRQIILTEFVQIIFAFVIHAGDTRLLGIYLTSDLTKFAYIMNRIFICYCNLSKID